MRTVSLLPAATEIVGALGRMDDLVGVSHECNFPPAANEKPRVTACEIYGRDIPSADIDRWVCERLSRGEDLFTLDEALLRELEPKLILTQRLCDVCAPAWGSVSAFAETLPGPPRVLNLEPSRLADILENVRAVAEAMRVPEEGERVVAELQQRIDFVERTARQAERKPRVAVVEWLDPVFCSGHWTPELVELAGGNELLGKAGVDSVRMTWDDVARAEPEQLVIACCGQSAARALRDWDAIRDRPDVRSLDAVQAGRVDFVDGNAYFSRPGPRIVDTLEILAEIIHPELFAGCFPDRGVRSPGVAAPVGHVES